MLMPWTIIFLTLSILGDLITVSNGKFLGAKKFHSRDNKTPDSININSNEVKKIHTLPLKVFENGLESILLINTGYSVELIEDEPFSANIITGGVLGFKKYVFGKTEFYWTNSSHGNAFTTVNGKGTPLVICILYYNIKYKSFNNALNYRDGLAKICFPVQVGPLSNPLFDEFALYLKEIRKPNTSVKLKLLPAFIFYALTPPTTQYYAYQGSYTNRSTGKTYFCTTTIITPAFSFHFISFKQFQETFLSLLDHNGKPLTNNPQTVPQRSVLQSAGILKIPNLLKIKTNIKSS